MKFINNQQMNNITLSYVITTYNKLPYLKEVMKRLLENVQEDEEIVVTDGASTDGTVEYLTELYQQGKIHQFISEPDKGEAHGFNKGMLMARGELIKIITDDDVFYYPGIQECKKFMLENEFIDIMGGTMSIIEVENHNCVRIQKFYEYEYRKWLETNTPFQFSGLPLMLRKSSLALTGIFFTGTMLVDREFTLRITHLKTCIAWYTGLMAMRIGNPKSNVRKVLSPNMNKKPKPEENLQRYILFYNPKLHYETMLRERPILEILQEIMKRPLRIIKKIFTSLYQTVSINEDVVIIENKKIHSNNLTEIFDACESTLIEYNQLNPPTFLSKKSTFTKLDI